MWHNGVFGNPTAGSVFESRPHMTTAKAVMINTAVQWEMAGTDLTRVRQGFGRADLTNLYNLRGKMFVVNETDVLTNLQTKSYTKAVLQNSTDPLKITLVYADPMGSPSATRARVNDLTLKVTAPDGTVYWGNNGLGVGGGMWSTSGGAANVVDTAENVFIQTPAAGLWTIEVVASELVQDARPETGGVIDADYSLVVSGISPAATVPVGGRVTTNAGKGLANAVVTLTDTNNQIRTTRADRLGYYRFDDVETGKTYTFSAKSKRYVFTPQTVTVNEELTELNFVAAP